MNDTLKSSEDLILHLKAKLIDLSLEHGPKVIAALLMLIAGFIIARWVCARISKWLEKIEMEPPVRKLIVRIAWLAVMVLTLVVALTQLGLKLEPVIAGIGVAGVGVGLAMQGVLSNLMAGLLIIFTKPFRVGEYIELLGVRGQVQGIELFSTHLIQADLSRLVIPNRKIIGEILHNCGRMRQLDLVVGVGYSTNLNDALAIVRNLLAANPRVLKNPEPVVGVSMLADSSILIAIKPWVKVDDYGAAAAELNQAIVEAFREKRIEIPFPQREVRVLSGGDFTGRVA